MPWMPPTSTSLSSSSMVVSATTLETSMTSITLTKTVNGGLSTTVHQTQTETLILGTATPSTTNKNDGGKLGVGAGVVGVALGFAVMMSL